MYCSNCGTNQNNNNIFCVKCGVPIRQTSPLKKEKKKISINTILIILICIVLLSTILGVGFIVTQNKKRVILIYMVGSDLESKSGLASRDLLDIDYEKTSKNGTKVLLMAGGARSWNNSFVNTLETSIYELQENGFQKVEERSLSNMGTAQTLSYFLNFGYERYKRVKFDLIFWNHGGAVDGNEYDQLHFNDNLKIPELREAFDSSPFKNRNKLEVISFRTCLNSTIEMANLLKNYSKYLVASEEVTVGSKFASALSFINDITKKDKAIDYATKEIDNYKNTITTLCNMVQIESKEENYCVNTTYSAIDLSKIDRINKELDSFSKELNDNISTKYNEIAKLRSNLEQYGEDQKEYDMIDLYDLANKLKNYNSASKVMKEIDNAVIYNFTNNDYSHGISIYFPYNSSDFLQDYNLISSSKTYTDFIQTFYTKKTSQNKGIGFSKGKTETIKKDNGEADFSITLTEEEKNNFAKANCLVFVDMKDGYHKLLYISKSPILEGNELKDTLKGKMLRISNIDYEDEKSSEWLTLVEQESKEDYIEAKNVMILRYGQKHSDVAVATIRIDSSHPKGYIKSLIINDKDTSETNKKMYFSEEAIKIDDYSLIETVTQSYKITTDDNKFDPNYLKNGNKKYTGKVFPTNAYKFILEDFNSKYDYYGVFQIEDIYGNITYSNLVKMN